MSVMMIYAMAFTFSALTIWYARQVLDAASQMKAVNVKHVIAKLGNSRSNGPEHAHSISIVRSDNCAIAKILS